jgi:lipopolysaccharide/colanic/teichoic acid biosynthesis glycosyltransferase
MYKHFFKRLIDFSASFIALLLLAPILLVVTFLLAIANKGKPFFFQTRPGKHEKLFKIIKFKTMNDTRDKEGNLLPDAKRLTPLGKFVRSTSLDELPQLLNVLKGEMSLIGPRPLLVKYLPLYSDEQRKRHSVRPGITGWAQVNGRNAISWKQKFELDVVYVTELSFIFDVKIVLATIKKVLFREGIASTTSVTMEEFKGN